jgi:2'-5' RNA ligase
LRDRIQERVRAFVAVELAPEIRAALAEEIERLRSLGGDVKWVSTENLHLTLKFLGQVDRRRIGDILKALGEAAGECPPFRIECGGVSLFPKPVRPRVVAVGVDEAGARSLGGLAEGVEGTLSGLGFGREERRFWAHVTMGRVKTPKGLKALADGILTADGAPFGDQEVREIALFMSELGREGPRYTALGRVQLAG